MNWALFLAVVGLVLEFGSSSSLAAAYGISVSGTMIITTLLVYVVARRAWGWGRLRSMLILGAFLTVDIAFFGAAGFVTIGWGGNPADRASVGGKSALFGTLLQMAPSGKYKMLADIAAHELEFNDGGGNPDSNPYNTLAQPGRRIVVDPGANALVEVLSNGRTRTFAVPPRLPPVPPIPAPRESVPTSVVEGPDGAIYVGQLTSFPFWQGTSSVLRIASDGSSIETYASGFTAIVDLAFDTGGALYVLEVASGQVAPFPPPPPSPGLGIGRLLRVCPGGAPEVLLSGLDYASGIAIGPDDAAYLTNHGTSPTDGEVLRLPLTPCP